MNPNTIAPFLKVVTVDDSPLIAERMASVLLEIEGLAFLGNAFSISSAQNLITTVNPDVVILDIHLEQDEQAPTGIDLLTEIRQNYPEMKVIIFTNHNELHYRLACLAKGANFFFDKSNDLHKISEILKQWTIRK
ncbi:MAG: response regulator transcription factor [Bacteroidota bacterium]|nr:response regulator transcription factor [Bacteroidota bacterium]